jgi:hypothetical protein
VWGYFGFAMGFAGAFGGALLGALPGLVIGLLMGFACGLFAHLTGRTEALPPTAAPLPAEGGTPPTEGPRGRTFARSSTLFVVLGMFAVYSGDRSLATGLVAVFFLGLGVLLGILPLFGVGRPAGLPYKAPWITLSFGCMILLVIGLGAMSAVVRGRAQANAPATGPFIDRVNGFRLDDPGHGWTIISQEKLRNLNEAAAAGAQSGSNLGGMVFVETPDPDFQIAGHEQEVGQQMIDLIDVGDKRVVFNRPDELDGRKAVRCQVVGKLAGRGIRYEAVALIVNGRFYRLMAVGASDQTSDDGLAFRPFMDAFHLLPTEPQAAPPGQ